MMDTFNFHFTQSDRSIREKDESLRLRADSLIFFITKKLKGEAILPFFISGAAISYKIVVNFIAL
jgi:hypothetical protein